MLALEDVESRARETVALETGDLVEIPAGVAHCFDVSADGQALEFSQVHFDAADVYPFPVEKLKNKAAQQEESPRTLK